jgi:hypothetical protein
MSESMLIPQASDIGDRSRIPEIYFAFDPPDGLIVTTRQ